MTIYPVLLVMAGFCAAQYVLCRLYNWWFYGRRLPVNLYSFVSGLVFLLFSMVSNFMLPNDLFYRNSWVVVLYGVIFLMCPFLATVVIDGAARVK